MTKVNEEIKNENLNEIDTLVVDAKDKEIEELKNTLKEMQEEFSKIEKIKVETENGTSNIDIISDSQKTKKELDKLPKVRIAIPRSELNPEDKIVDVAINGYTYRIERGVDVEVPDEVYKLLKLAKYI